ncbi:MAG TPA: DUF4384 domain-containing protein, partial [Gammaproteobacteria bacterium]
MTTIALFNQLGRHFIICLTIMILFCNLSFAQNSNTKALEQVTIEITTHLGDKQSFVEQDVISFFISLNRAAFLYGFYQDASGHVFQIIPGKAQPEHYFQPGFYIPFPPQNSSFQFVVQAPFGEEQLWVFASEQGQLEFKGKDTSQGIKLLKMGHKEIENYIRASSSQLFGQA